MIKSNQNAILRWRTSVSIGTLLAALAAAPSFAAEAAAVAAPLAAADTTSALGEIVVTARKRTEKLLEVPVAVSALTGKDIEARGIVTMDDIAKFTPGMNDFQASTGGARVDRSFQQIIIRGMTPVSTTNPTTSIFINGVPVVDSSFLQYIDGAERVEVLKGPQSAYFGRDTFAGAINVITRTPSETLGGFLSAAIGTRDTRNFAANLSGPIIKDKLSFDAGVFFDAHDGSYKNAASDGQLLGNQSTKGAHFSILARPVEDLTVKLYSTIFQENDGPAATGVLLPTGRGAFAQTNCTVNGRAYLCGTLPGLISSVSPAQNSSIAAFQAFVANPRGIIKNSDTVKGFGLKRDAYHTDLNIDYAIPSLGLTLTSLSGFDYSAYSEISDLAVNDAQPGGQYPGYNGLGAPGGLGFPYMIQNIQRDASQEFRLSSDQAKPIRGMIGVSYVERYSESGGGAALNGAINAVTAVAGSKTSGVFFALAYDVLPKVTLNFDGRYQVDDESAYTASRVRSAEAKYYNFVPRATIQYKMTSDLMTYFTYSEGVNPGAFNSAFLALPVVTQNFLSSLGLGGLVVKPEKITNYELGIKGQFLGGRATLSADIYYDKWTQQLNANVYNFAPCGDGNPYNQQFLFGTTPNPSYHANVPPTCYSQYSYPYVDNSASTVARGIEIDGRLAPIDHVTVNVSAALNDARYDSINCTTCLPLGTTVERGTQLPFQSKYSLTAGAQYASNISSFGTTDWFVRGDFVYKSGVYIQASNLTRTPDYEQLNVSAGVNWPNVALTGYINNVTNTKTFVSAFQNSNFAGGFAPDIDAGLPQLITAGVKIKYRF